MLNEATMGALSIMVGGLASIAVAWISRPRKAPADGPEDGPDLTTIAGIAAVVAQQGEKLGAAEQRIDELESGRAADGRLIRALRRRCAQLEEALRQLGAAVPEPAPDDAPLIKG
ncbi:hypothetical protein [Streptomyces erythrochromogenes]|uniref:hypothetical protein n=1 Tax=Streptomyces erythrochromogenes TaxID=285574 RepID=UPI003406A181